MSKIRITRLELIKFGKFADYSINISDGMNVIYGDNEAGKSTIQLFIKFMLFGIPSRGGKRDKIKDREKIIPWQDNKAAGKLFLIKDGREIEIYREFRKRPSGDIVKVTDRNTGENYFNKEIKSEDVGLLLLGMSRQMFERTVWVTQSSICMQGSDDEITARLINLLESGSTSDVSIKSAVSGIETKIAGLKAKDGRSAPGEIDLLNRERIELNKTLSEQRAFERKRNVVNQEINSLTQRKLKLDDEIKHFEAVEKSERAKEKILRIDKIDSCLQKEMQIANTRQFQLFKHNAVPEKVESLRLDSEHIDELEVKAYQTQQELLAEQNCFAAEEKKRKRLIYYLIGAAVLAVILAVLGFVSGVGKNIFYWITAGAVVLFLIAAGIIFGCIIHNNIVKLKESLISVGNELSLIRKEISETEKRFSESLSILECDTLNDFNEKFRLYSEDKAKINMVRELYEELLGGDVYQELKIEADNQRKFIIESNNTETDNIEQKLDSLIKEKDEISGRILELKQLKLDGGLEIPLSDIENNIKLVDEQITEKEDEYSAYQAAKEGLSQAYAKIKSDYTPLLNAETERILTRLTGGQHDSIKVAEDFSLSLKETDKNIDLKQAEFFSTGTYNQIYLALRLAIIRLTLSASDSVIFLDDVLTTFDDGRSRDTLEVIREICVKDGYQCLLFTCHHRDMESIKKYPDINIMEVIL